MTTYADRSLAARCSTHLCTECERTRCVLGVEESGADGSAQPAIHFRYRWRGSQRADGSIVCIAEGMNSKIRTAVKQAYGFREPSSLTAMIYLRCSGVAIPPVVHVPHCLALCVRVLQFRDVSVDIVANAIVIDIRSSDIVAAIEHWQLALVFQPLDGLGGSLATWRSGGSGRVVLLAFACGDEQWQQRERELQRSSRSVARS